MWGRSKRSAKSKGHLFYGPKYVDEARREWIRQQDCHVMGVPTGAVYLQAGRYVRTIAVVVAHVKSRGSSGRDKGNMIPLDAKLHDEQGVIGWPAFCRKYGIEDRRAVAAEYERRYQAEQQS